MQFNQKHGLRNWCISVFLAATVASAPVPALAERLEEVLADHLSISIVCLESPDESGWTDISHSSRSISSARYGLLVNLPEKPNRPLQFSIEPYKYRLSVGAFPCFYGFSSHEYRGCGTALNVADVAQDHVKVDGLSFPRIADDFHVVPIIRAMIEKCERDKSSWPYMQTFQSCEHQISDALVEETIAIVIHYDPNRPDAFEQILFIRGLPYIDGKPLLQF